MLSLSIKITKQITGTPGVEGAFSDKITPDIDGFADEPVV